MIIDQVIVNALKEKYSVRNIESTYYSMDDGTVSMEFTHSGFARLIRDVSSTECTVPAARDVFSIAPLEIKNAKDVVYVAKFSTDKYPLDFIEACGEKLRLAFEAEGCKLIFMPQIIDVSVFTVEQLSEMRDGLTELINALSYDNIIGF